MPSKGLHDREEALEMDHLEESLSSKREDLSLISLEPAEHHVLVVLVDDWRISGTC